MDQPDTISPMATRGTYGASPFGSLAARDLYALLSMSPVDIIGIIGVVASVVGIPLTWWLSRSSRQRARMKWVVNHDVLVSPESHLLSRGLNLAFYGEEIK